jgi:hypothetical protein
MRSEFEIIDKNNATFTMHIPDVVTDKEFKCIASLQAAGIRSLNY